MFVLETMENKNCIFTKLPYIALMTIFEYLDKVDISKLSYTCKTVFCLINSKSELSKVKNMQLLEYNDIDFDSLTYRLEILDMSGSEIDDTMLFELAHKRKLRLKAVNLGFCTHLTNKSFQYFFTLQKELTYIGLADSHVEREVKFYSFYCNTKLYSVCDNYTYFICKKLISKKPILGHPDT